MAQWGHRPWCPRDGGTGTGWGLSPNWLGMFGDTGQGLSPSPEGTPGGIWGRSGTHVGHEVVAACGHQAEAAHVGVGLDGLADGLERGDRDVLGTVGDRVTKGLGMSPGAGNVPWGLSEAWGQRWPGDSGHLGTRGHQGAEVGAVTLGTSQGQGPPPWGHPGMGPNTLGTPNIWGHPGDIVEATPQGQEPPPWGHLDDRNHPLGDTSGLDPPRWGHPGPAGDTLGTVAAVTGDSGSVVSP